MRFDRVFHYISNVPPGSKWLVTCDESVEVVDKFGKTHHVIECELDGTPSKVQVTIAFLKAAMSFIIAKREFTATYDRDAKRWTCKELEMAARVIDNRRDSQ